MKKIEISRSKISEKEIDYFVFNINTTNNTPEDKKNKIISFVKDIINENQDNIEEMLSLINDLWGALDMNELYYCFNFLIEGCFNIQYDYFAIQNEFVQSCSSEEIQKKISEYNLAKENEEDKKILDNNLAFVFGQVNNIVNNHSIKEDEKIRSKDDLDKWVFSYTKLLEKYKTLLEGPEGYSKEFSIGKNPRIVRLSNLGINSERESQYKKDNIEQIKQFYKELGILLSNIDNGFIPNIIVSSEYPGFNELSNTILDIDTFRNSKFTPKIYGFSRDIGISSIPNLISHDNVTELLKLKEVIKNIDRSFEYLIQHRHLIKMLEKRKFTPEQLKSKKNELQKQFNVIQEK